jgi:O-antigen/teichoic acid export membrane protein
MTDRRAYQSLAARVRYPAAAMLISQTVLTFGATAFLARALGPRGFGQYALVLTITGIFQLIAAFPVESGIPKFLAETRGAHGSGESAARSIQPYYVAGLWCRLAASSTALVLCAFGARPLVAAYGASPLGLPVLLAAVSLCLLTPLSSYFMSCIQGMEQPRRWAAGNLLTAGAVFPFLLAGGLRFATWGLPGLMLSIAVGWLIAVGITGWLARRSLGFLWPGGAAAAQLRQLLPFLLPISIVPLAGFGARTIMRLLLASRWGATSLGYFEISLSLLGHLAVVYQACNIVLLPEWARLYAAARPAGGLAAHTGGAAEAAELLESYARARGVLLGIAAVYGAALVFGGQWVVPAVFGRDQAGAVPVVRVIGLVMPAMIAGWVASTTNVVSNRTRSIGWANVIWFSVAIPVSFALIPALGALGAGLSWLGAYAVFAWYYVSRARPFFREVEAWAAWSGARPTAPIEAQSGMEETGA